MFGFVCPCVCVRVCVPHLHFLVTHVTEANDLLKEQNPAPTRSLNAGKSRVSSEHRGLVRGPSRRAHPEKPRLPGALALHGAISVPGTHK